MRLGQAPARFPARGCFQRTVPRQALPGLRIPRLLPAGWRKQLHLPAQGWIPGFPKNWSRALPTAGPVLPVRGGRLIRMLGDGDAAENDVLCGSHGDAVVLQGEIARFCTYRVDGFVQQVPLAGGNFTDAVIRSAGVFLGGEFAPVRRGVGIQQGFAFEQPVHSAIQSGVALRFNSVLLGLLGGIYFIHLHGEFLQNIGKAHAGGLAGVDGHLLGFRLDIFVRGLSVTV